MIDQGGNPFTLYEMDVTQRIELPEKKNAIVITHRSGDPEGNRNLESKVCGLKFEEKDLFQIRRFYCKAFGADDIPDRLWQEAEYGINQEGND